MTDLDKAKKLAAQYPIDKLRKAIQISETDEIADMSGSELEDMDLDLSDEHYKKNYDLDAIICDFEMCPDHFEKILKDIG